jgi:hypothetical protein
MIPRLHQSQLSRFFPTSSFLFVSCYFPGNIGLWKRR